MVGTSARCALNTKSSIKATNESDAQLSRQVDASEDGQIQIFGKSKVCNRSSHRRPSFNIANLRYLNLASRPEFFEVSFRQAIEFMQQSKGNNDSASHILGALEKDYERTIANLTQQVVALKSSEETRKAHITRLKKENNTLKRSFQTFQDENVEMEALLQQCKDENTKLRYSAKMCKDEVQRLETGRARYAAKVKESEDWKNQLRTLLLRVFEVVS